MTDTYDFGGGPVTAHKHPNGGGWVADTAYVGPNAKVFGNAKVSGNAKVFGNAVVSGYAEVSGDARVSDNARVSGYAEVSGYVRVSDNAEVSGNAKVSGNAEVSGYAEVSGDVGGLKYASKDNQTISSLVEEYYKLAGAEPEVSLSETLIYEEYEEWYDETEQIGVPHQPELELKELADLLYVIYGYALARGWDVEEAVRRVHENNVGRMKQPDGSIKRRADGKIMKNKDYPKVDLKGLT